MANIGLITDIQRFCLHDGPGIRTTVFLKGCNLTCKWCHNPETQSCAVQWQYFKEKCLGCQFCVQSCPKHALQHTADGIVRDKAACIMCGTCSDICYAEAIMTVGEEMDVASLVDLLQRDVELFGDTGGVTFSGGEPLLQYGFLKEVLIQLKQRQIHVAVDTAGYVPWEYFEEVLPYANVFLYDIKGVDPHMHQKYVGADNTLIFDNLRRLTATKRQEVWIRVPLIHGVNDKDEDIHLLGEFLRSLSGFARLDLLPYHNYGVYKARSIGLKADEFKVPSQERMQHIQKQLKAMGFNAHVL
jgi:pyruvate formate lyase activating enzyme